MYNIFMQRGGWGYKTDSSKRVGDCVVYGKNNILGQCSRNKRAFEVMAVIHTHRGCKWKKYILKTVCM